MIFGLFPSAFFCLKVFCLERFKLEIELIQIAALNELLVIKEHQRHQEITKSLQNFAHPSSVDYIKTVLEGSFDHLDYNCSDSDVIAKWFSHALSRIGTEDAIDIIKKYANSSDEGIKHEMQYRLDKIKT
mgnify:CR=1 FL=1